MSQAPRWFPRFVSTAPNVRQKNGCGQPLTCSKSPRRGSGSALMHAKPICNRRVSSRAFDWCMGRLGTEYSYSFVFAVKVSRCVEGGSARIPGISDQRSSARIQLILLKDQQTACRDQRTACRDQRTACMGGWLACQAARRMHVQLHLTELFS